MLSLMITKRLNISTQHILTLLVQHLQALAKQSFECNKFQNCWATGHPLRTCRYMLGIENQTSVNTGVQHCCTKLAK